MYFNVSARREGQTNAFHDEDVVGEQELVSAIATIQAMSDANQEPYHLSIKPREHLMVITPDPTTEETQAMPKKPEPSEESKDSPLGRAIDAIQSKYQPPDPAADALDCGS